MYLSPCSTDYLKALTDPFGNASNVCIPDLIDQQSSKYRLVTRGSVAIGSGGFGFISINTSEVIASDATSVWLSSNAALFAGTVVTAAPGPGIQSTSFTQAPYTQTDLAVPPHVPSIRGRTVAVGVRVRYIGTELQRGGRVVLVRKAYGIDANGLGIVDALADRTAISLPVNRNWIGVNYLPTDAFDYEYQFYGGTGNTERLAIMIESTPGNLFEYEAVAYVEYIGVIVNASPSHSDIVGMSALKDAINHQQTVEPAGPGMFNSMLNFVANVGAQAISHPTASTIGTNLLIKGAGAWA